ncbi:unnamed protein product [Candidula unifasciata]|uniref:N-acetyltransferase domain-containing protein n=1 Tax=Candidula unifasciata TaxID=100452 RepID=A0A8S3ZH84_9EUPU|nr:unnamed protein product [Candidula unifasciata]
MATSPRIVVRKAQEEDYEAVINITKEISLGADYLYVQYSELINDADSSYYVCEVDGEVAAFEGVSLLDDNNTLMARSARVKDKFRGQGLLNRIRKKIYDDYKDVPGQKRIRNCCTNIVRLVDSATFRSQNRFLGTRALTVYDPLDVVKVPAAYTDDIPEVRTVDPEILRYLFEEKELSTYLFPLGFLVVISWFFDPLVSNIKHIKKQHPCVSISAVLGESIEQLTSTSNIEKSYTNSKEKARGLLVFCCHYKTPTMIFFNIEIYGKPVQGQEDSELRPFIFHGLKQAVSVMEQDHSKLPPALGISTDTDELLQVCKNIVAPLGFYRDKMGAFTSQNFFEQEFEQLANY